MDIEEAKILKAKLEMHILSELRAFEDATKLCVEAIHIHRYNPFGSELGEAYEVKVRCKV